MTEVDVVSFMNRTLYLTLMLSMPVIVVASVVGVLFSLFQALTQIQEQTLSFAVKLLAVGITLAVSAGWMGGNIYAFTLMVFDTLPRLH